MRGTGSPALTPGSDQDGLQGGTAHPWPKTKTKKEVLDQGLQRRGNQQPPPTQKKRRHGQTGGDNQGATGCLVVPRLRPKTKFVRRRPEKKRQPEGSPEGRCNKKNRVTSAETRGLPAVLLLTGRPRTKSGDQ